MKTKSINITKTLLRKHGCSADEVAKYAGQVKIRRWTFGAKKRAQSKAATYDVITQKGDFDAMIFTIWKFVGCIEEAPFPVTPEEIEQLPDFVGELIEDAINEVVGITLDTIRNLESR
jgi:hypothetical protein